MGMRRHRSRRSASARRITGSAPRRHVDQNLGFGEQERPGRDLPGGEEQDWPPVVGVDDLEFGREHAVRGKHGWRHLRLRYGGLMSANEPAKFQRTSADADDRPLF